MGECDAKLLSLAYQSLLRLLALPFSPLSSEGALCSEVAEICRRRCDSLLTQGVSQSRAFSASTSSLKHQSSVVSAAFPARRLPSSQINEEAEDLSVEEEEHGRVAPSFSAAS